ncbi:hypothetical protein GF312_15670 [Candidatus Poribacteria bacterium]|nr:hypothetical protein [Candidatus Poribacteria bacterium]
MSCSSFHNFHFLISILMILGLIYACSTVTPPDNYYENVLEMENYGEETRQETGRKPGEVVKPPESEETEVVENTPMRELPLQEDQKSEEKILVVENEKSLEEQDPPPMREIIEEPKPAPKAIPVNTSADVMKIAMNNADLGIGARNVEIVNGRLNGGKNSVRVNFLCNSIDRIYEKFVGICAVIYHLDKNAESIDVIVGIAEDDLANMIAIIQSDMDDVTAWMTDEISRSEWFSKITVKIL